MLDLFHNCHCKKWISFSFLDGKATVGELPQMSRAVVEFPCITMHQSYFKNHIFPTLIAFIGRSCVPQQEKLKLQFSTWLRPAGNFLHAGAICMYDMAFNQIQRFWCKHNYTTQTQINHKSRHKPKHTFLEGTQSHWTQQDFFQSMFRSSAWTDLSFVFCTLSPVLDPSVVNLCPEMWKLNIKSLYRTRDGKYYKW